MWSVVFLFSATNRKFSGDCLISVLTSFVVVTVKTSVVLHNFVRDRDGYKFEDALTVTGLEDVPDGQSAWAVNSEQYKEYSS
jgi:hypothetical protein